MDYYTHVEGIPMDRRLLTLAEDAIKGKGDGRISKHDAEKLLAAVVDGNQFTEVEKDTVAHIRRTFRWTETARDWF